MALRGDRVALTLAPRPPGALAYRWLCAALREAILDGRLRPGARLPTTRDLAHRYRLSRGTIVTAFDQTKAEGSLPARTGPGTYVSAVLPDALLAVSAAPRAAGPARPPPRRLSAIASRVRPFPFREWTPPRA